MSDQRTRMKLEPRREQILAAAMQIATSTGYNSLTRDGVAHLAGVATGTVNHVFDTMRQLRSAVMCCAVTRAKRHNSPELRLIIAQGLAEGDSVAHGAPDWLKREALDLLMNSGE